MKFLLFLIVLGVIWVMWKKRPGSPRQKTGNADPAAVPERMVVCAHCGVHLPESEALTVGDKKYCSEAHRHAAAQ